MRGISVTEPNSDNMPLDADTLRGKVAISTYRKFQGSERDLLVVFMTADWRKRCPEAALVALTRGSKQLCRNNVFYSFWSDGNSDVVYTNGAGGQYGIQWFGNGDFVGGKGWNPEAGSRLPGGTYGPNPSANSYLSVYGWSTNPLGEYYINEDFGIFNPSTGLTCNLRWIGVQYLRRYTREPALDPGHRDFQPVLNHFNARAALGMHLGTLNYQIVAVEGLDSSGTATITGSG
ncbi:xylanase precursor [Mycena latifolia]|nr:xylanase precursor [Mycena latifolia]